MKFVGWQTIESLGRGGHAEVWLVSRRVHGGAQLGAAKSALCPCDDLRIISEAGALASLSHGSIPALLSVPKTKASNRLTLVTEHARGVDLHQLQGCMGRLPEPIARLIAYDAAHALAHCHSRGVVHRDVSASNIVAGSDGRAWLIDFGCALLTSAVRGDGYAVGKPGMQSPEARAGRSGPYSDVYALGLLLRRLLAGDDGPGCVHGSVPTSAPMQALIGQALLPQPGLRPSADAFAEAVNPPHKYQLRRELAALVLTLMGGRLVA